MPLFPRLSPSSLRHIGHPLQRRALACTLHCNHRVMAVAHSHNNNNNSISTQRACYANSGGFVMPTGMKSIKSTLDQIVDVSKLMKEDKTELEIADMWHAFHHFTTDLIGETLAAEQYAILRERYRKNPIFIIPVYKNVGYMNVVVQFQHPYILITSLREFQQRQANSQCFATFVHYTDLANRKGIVLMRGEVDTSREINKHEATEVMHMIRKFYLDDRLFHEFVETFNQRQHEFKYEHFLEVYRKHKPEKQKKKVVTDKNELKKHEYERLQKFEESSFTDVFEGKYREDLPKEKLGGRSARAEAADSEVDSTGLPVFKPK